MTGRDIRPGRLKSDALADNFADIHPPLGGPAALVEAERCYFCHDAPCTDACPTGIDIPSFIRKIHTGNLRGSARTILRENIMGGMCARVCPTEVLCEEACVRNSDEDHPVRIGLLQRHATDPVIETGMALFERGKPSGRRIAVVGGGPAGIACAHRLAMFGHESVVFCRDARAGGLNEYGIAAYKTVDGFAQRELDWILGIGGIELRTGQALDEDMTLAGLQADFDAVFLGVGLAGVNRLGVAGEDLDGVLNAVDYIAELRQAAALDRLPVGRRVVVIGGGMTAIDVAVQSRRLGAEFVDIVYRRGPADMGASPAERQFAQVNGVAIRHWSRPLRIAAQDDSLAVEFERTAAGSDGALTATGERWIANADVVFKAVGQALADCGLALTGGRIDVDDERRTSLPGVWAGGDCVHGGSDLTVTAVQDGKLAAHSIDRHLRAEAPAWRI